MHEVTNHVEDNGESVVCVFKVIPQSMGASHKSLVNIVCFSDDHFEDQAIKIKSLYYKYKAKRVIIDANGLINWSLILVII